MDLGLAAPGPEGARGPFRTVTAAMPSIARPALSRRIWLDRAARPLGSRYYVTHRAHNDQGPSEWSETTLGIATRSRAPERPEAPVRVDVATGPREVVIRWEHPESYNIPVQHYKARKRRTCQGDSKT